MSFFCSSAQGLQTLKSFTLLFPFKLNYQAASFVRAKCVPFGSRLRTQRFSDWPIRSARPAEMKPEDSKVGAPKSLIEDEAELSDWVSGLNSGLHAGTRSNEADESTPSNPRSRMKDAGGGDEHSARDPRKSGRGPRGFGDSRNQRSGKESRGFGDSRNQRAGRESRGFGDSRNQRTGRESRGFGDSRNQRAGRESRGFGDSRIQRTGRESRGFGDSRIQRTGRESRGFGDSRIQRTGRESRGFDGSRNQRTGKESRGFGGSRIRNAAPPQKRWADDDEDEDDEDEDDEDESESDNGRFRSNQTKKKKNWMRKTQSTLSEDDDDDDDDEYDESDDEKFISRQKRKGKFSTQRTPTITSRPKETLSDSDEDDDDDDESEDVENKRKSESFNPQKRRTFSPRTGNPNQRRMLSTNNPIPFADPDDADADDEELPKKATGSHLTQTRFDQCPISPYTLKAIAEAGYETMTVVQEATLPIILQGKDVLAKARTGTGKTVAFLVPCIEVISKSPDQKHTPITVLIVCPTRELAGQAATEANKLLKHHSSVGVQLVIGGTSSSLEQKRMQANPCQILVGTPGRLNDHIENTAGFATRLRGVKIVVLDEADNLLDMGFRKSIDRIIAAVPKERQTLLFSATVPQEVLQICKTALRNDHQFVNTVEEGSEETHSQVKQTCLVAAADRHFSLLYSVLRDHVVGDADYKVIVFCTTAAMTRLVSSLLSNLHLNVREIHSRKSQTYRTRVSDEFRKSKGLILVSSDVSARGVDYPDVTLVVQFGMPSDRQQYIHRLGRTGREGKRGEGILLLGPWEEYFLSCLKDLPVREADVPPVAAAVKADVDSAIASVDMRNKEMAYQAWLGYYNSRKEVGHDKCELVQLANRFSKTMGLNNPPAIPKLVLSKMGLKNIPGLNSR